MPRFIGLAVAACVLGASWAATAQPGLADRRTEEIVRSLRLAERNQLGILQYCRASGAVSEEVVALQRAALLPGAGFAGLDEAEAEGRQRIVAFADSKVSIAAAASGEGMTVASRCKQIAMTVQAQAGQPATW